MGAALSFLFHNHSQVKFSEKHLEKIDIFLPYVLARFALTKFMVLVLSINITHPMK